MTDMSDWTSAENTETLCNLPDNVRSAVLNIMYPRNPFCKEYPNTRGIVPNIEYAVVLECGDTTTVSNKDGNIFFDSYREAGEFLNYLQDSPHWDHAVKIKEFRTDD